MTKPKNAAAESGKPLDYWQESARPLVSLVFIAPMLAAYEGGMLLLGSEASRNGADVWLRHWLDFLGFGQFFLLPAAACGILLAWHHTKREPWMLRPGVLAGMTLESLLLGFLLLVLAQIQGSFLVSQASSESLALRDLRTTPRKVQATLEKSRGGPPRQPQLPDASSEAEVCEESLMARIVCYCGAGIYEELLFRLMLLPALAALFALAGAARTTSLVGAVVVGSLLFSAAHYRVFTSVGDEFAWFSFLFRALAGLFFSVLFVRRGFGIAAGAHALYDVFVAILS